MRRLPYMLLLLMLLGPATRSEGAPILYDFTVDFMTGALGGESFQGSLSVDGDDCPGGICDGVFDPDGPLNLLSFDITIDGVAFDIADDLLYPNFPTVSFLGGNLVGINYLTEVPVDPFLGILLNPFFNSVDFRNAAGQLSSGIVEQASVPEPASLLMLGLGFAGMGVRRWRQGKTT